MSSARKMPAIEVMRQSDLRTSAAIKSMSMRACRGISSASGGVVGPPTCWRAGRMGLHKAA
jgi:hypothetical protein